MRTAFTVAGNESEDRLRYLASFPGRSVERKTSLETDLGKRTFVLCNPLGNGPRNAGIVVDEPFA